MKLAARRVLAIAIAVVTTMAAAARARTDDASPTDDTVPVAVLPHAKTWRLSMEGGESRRLLRLTRGSYTATIGDASTTFALQGPTAIEYHEPSPILRYGGLGAMALGLATAGVTFWIASHECDSQTTLTPGTSIPQTRRPCDAGDADAHSRERTQLTLVLVGSGGVVLAIAGGFAFFAAKPWISVEPLDVRELGRSRARTRERAGVLLRFGIGGATVSGAF